MHSRDHFILAILNKPSTNFLANYYCILLGCTVRKDSGGCLLSSWHWFYPPAPFPFPGSLRHWNSCLDNVVVSNVNIISNTIPELSCLDYCCGLTNGSQGQAAAPCCTKHLCLCVCVCARASKKLCKNTRKKEHFMLTVQIDVSPLQHPQHLKDHPGGRYLRPDTLP